MRKIVITEFLTLDGIMEAPNEWSFPYWNDEIAAFKYGEMKSGDALLLGRETYDGFAKAWPSQKDEQGFADMMNNYPKYVVSKTLKKAEWNNSHVLDENFLQEIARLKEKEGKDIMVHGSAQLANTLLETGLADQLQVLVYPVVVGKGKKLFTKGHDAKLELIQSQSYETGVVLLQYHVKA